MFDFARAPLTKVPKVSRVFITVRGFPGTMSTEANPANLPNSAMLGHVSSLEEVTNNFHYKDTSVTLHVGDQVFSVRNFLKLVYAAESALYSRCRRIS